MTDEESINYAVSSTVFGLVANGQTRMADLENADRSAHRADFGTIVILVGKRGHIGVSSFIGSAIAQLRWYATPDLLA